MILYFTFSIKSFVSFNLSAEQFLEYSRVKLLNLIRNTRNQIVHSRHFFLQELWVGIFLYYSLLFKS